MKIIIGINAGNSITNWLKTKSQLGHVFFENISVIVYFKICVQRKQVQDSYSEKFWISEFWILSSDAWLHPLFWGPYLLVWTFWFVIRLRIYEFGIWLRNHDRNYLALGQSNRAKLV